MISSKRELAFYIKADMMINRGYFKPTFSKRISHLFCPDIIMSFLRSMRCYSYYRHQNGLINNVVAIYYKLRYMNLSKKCGFSIDCDCFGYGLLLNHYGTIVVGGGNTIGHFAALYTSTCITQSGSTIGDFLFMGSGAVITKKVQLGNNVKISANSVVNKSIRQSNIVIAGQPASIKRETNTNWIEEYDNSTVSWVSRYNMIMELKSKISI